jgi:hypothetical protein
MMQLLCMMMMQLLCMMMMQLCRAGRTPVLPPHRDAGPAPAPTPCHPPPAQLRTHQPAQPPHLPPCCASAAQMKYANEVVLAAHSQVGELQQKVRQAEASTLLTAQDLRGTAAEVSCGSAAAPAWF